MADAPKAPASQVKAYLKEAHDLRCGGETPDALSEKIKDILDDAAKRAKESGKATVAPWML